MRRLLAGILGAAVVGQAVVVTAVSAAPAGAAPPPAAAKWSFETTPNPAGATVSNFSSVSCASAIACTATGNWARSLSAPENSLADRRIGGRWTITKTPSPTGAEGSDIHGVSCAVVEDCLAVGNYTARPGTSTAFAERWNGSAWALETPARADNSELLGVSCASQSFCEVVGSSGNNAFAESFNGKKWTVQTVPKAAGDSFSRFEAVSCTSPQACTAVGYASDPSNARSLVGRWNGRRWVTELAPGPSGTSLSDLAGVSCYSPQGCVAVGTWARSSGPSMTLSEVWNGGSWQIERTPNPAGTVMGGFSSVSCAAAGGCVAVGSYTLGNMSPPIPLAEKQTGSRWVLQTLPAPAHASSGDLLGVSCTASSACTAVGYFTTTTGVFTLAERYS